MIDCSFLQSCIKQAVASGELRNFANGSRPNRAVVQRAMLSNEGKGHLHFVIHGGVLQDIVLKNAQNAVTLNHCPNKLRTQALLFSAQCQIQISGFV